jgi:carboxyl-terminal processing protease
MLLASGCAKQDEGLLFDREYASLCDAYTDITKYALKIHVNKNSDQYGELRQASAKSLAEKMKFQDPLPSTSDCQDIEAIADSQQKKTKKEIYSSSLNYFMQAMDPHSVFIAESHAEQRRLSDRNIEYDIGFEPKYVHRAIKEAMPIDNIFVDFVYPNTPTFNQLTAGDEIESINGEDIKGKYFGEVSDIIGDHPPSIEIKIKRLDEPLKFTPHQYKKPTLYSRTIEYNKNRIEWIRVTRFTEGVSLQLRTKLEEVNKSNVNGVVLDLRGNPGGLVEEGVGVLQLFILKGGEVFHTEGPRKSSQFSHVYKVNGDAIYIKPLIVLVDSDTASIAEAVAAVLRNKSRALILGNKTFGKATVQVTQPNSPKNGLGGLLITTVSLIYYPNEDTHQMAGVPPHYILQDDRLEEAVEILRQNNQLPILHEKDYSNAILPHEGSSPISPNTLVATLDVDPNESGDFSKTCNDVPYQNCLEAYATRFLEIMINRHSVQP